VQSATGCQYLFARDDYLFRGAGLRRRRQETLIGERVSSVNGGGGLAGKPWQQHLVLRMIGNTID
jgi:hypothetical protein